MKKIRSIFFAVSIVVTALAWSQHSRSALVCAEALSSAHVKIALPIHPKLEKEIVQLSDHQQFQETLYDEFSIDDIGRAIVSRVKRQESDFKELLKNDKQVDLRKDADIILFFWSSDFNSIKEKGFLNQHESGKSKGTYDPTMRMAWEDNFTGIKMGYSEQAKKMRPKYAFLNIRANVDLARKRYDVTKQYGDIGAVFKDYVKNRSTWTSCDSLGLVKRNQHESVDELINWKGTFDRGSISLNSNFEAYYESQIYGRISFDDVEYFLVTGGNQAEFLKQLGIPIYLLQRTERNNRIIYEKGALLFKGNKIELSKTEPVTQTHIAFLSQNSPVGKLSDIQRRTGGSTGGRWVQDEVGNQWFLKKDVYHSELQTSAEVISSKIYQFFGYRTPLTVKLVINGTPYSASKDIGENNTWTNFSDMNTSGIRQMRIVSAYLKDWDRLGNPSNNRLSTDQTLTILDFGGTLGARARGDHKPGKIFSKAIGNFETTPDVGIIYDAFGVQANANHPWNNLTRTDVDSAINKFRKLDDATIESIVDSAQYSNKMDRDYMIHALKIRRDGIIANLLSRFP